MTDKKTNKPDEPTVQFFDGEEENIAATDWDELEQKDRCDHVDKLQWGSETLALHEAREIMNEFKKRVHQTMRALVFGPMFRRPLRFLSLWKFLFLVEPDTFIDIVESNPVGLGLMKPKAFERYRLFVKMGPKVVGGWTWDAIGEDLGIPERTAAQIFDDLLKEIRAFQFPSAQIEIAIINAAFDALAADIQNRAYDDGDSAITKHLIEIGKQEKAKAEAEYEAFSKKPVPKF